MSTVAQGQGQWKLHCHYLAAVLATAVAVQRAATTMALVHVRFIVVAVTMNCCKQQQKSVAMQVFKATALWRGGGVKIICCEQAVKVMA